MAESAALALKAGLWFRRGRLYITSSSPDLQAKASRRQAETPPIVLCRFPGSALTDGPLGRRHLEDVAGDAANAIPIALNPASQRPAKQQP